MSVFSLEKAWTAMDSLLIICKSDISDKKMWFLPSFNRVRTNVWLHHFDSNETLKEKGKIRPNVLNKS